MRLVIVDRLVRSKAASSSSTPYRMHPWDTRCAPAQAAHVLPAQHWDAGPSWALFLTVEHGAWEARSTRPVPVSWGV